MLEVQPLLFYIVVAEAALLGAGVGALAFFYAKLIEKFAASKKSQQELEERLWVKEEEITKEAQIKAKKIIEEAYLSAQTVARQQEEFNAHAKDLLSQELSEVATRQAKNFGELNEMVRGQIVEVIQNISKDIKVGVETEVESFRTALQGSAVAQQELMRKKVDEHYSAVEKEIDLYKANRISYIDQSVTRIVQEVSLRVLGKTITPDEHEDLILKSLDQAKKDNVL